MKNYYSYLTTIIIVTLHLLNVNSIKSQDVGIGTATPDYRLHVCGTGGSLLKVDNTTVLNTNITSDMYFKTGNYYTAGIKTIGTTSNTARLGLFTYAATNTGAMFERMSILDNGFVGIGTNTPGYLLDVNGRIRLRNGNGTSGLFLMNAANNANAAFIGLVNDTHVGFYGSNGASWNLVMNTTNGNVGIGTQSPGSPLEVIGNDNSSGYFENISGGPIACGLDAHSDAVPGYGIGVRGEGGDTGLWGVAATAGNGDRIGVQGYAAYGNGTNYGLYGISNYGSTTNIGVYGHATGGNATNWAGYFAGNVYSTGTYQGSDRKLKNEIVPITNAMTIVNKLKPSAYLYRTSEYPNMELPEGIQYGLIADEVKQVMPGAVKKAIQPAAYENNDRKSGRIVKEEFEFEAVNYTAMIPILISAIQEQQAMIENQQKKIAELEQRLSSFDD